MPTRRGTDTHNRIMAAAEDCFAAQGYDATGVAEICERAGVTKGAFYHHFPSKQALFLELLERWLAMLDVQLEASGAGARSVPEALVTMASVVDAVFQEARDRVPLILEFWRQASRDPTIWEATVAPYRRYRDFFARTIQAGIDEGSLRSVQPEVVAGTLVSLAVGLLMQGLMDPDGEDWGEVARQSMRWLLSALTYGEAAS